MSESFWDTHGDEISAAITVAIAVLLAIGVDRFLIGRAERATERMETAVFSREARTRLRMIRRLIFVAIILIGVALALSQFTSIKRFATGVLASTAVLGLIIGFAGRHVIANLVAGVLMTITQPVRIGDQVVVGDEVRGRVLDIALTYTTVDSGNGAITVVPNEMLITEVVVNKSAGDLRAPATALVWVPADVDLARARAVLEGTEVSSVRLAELTPEGARLELKGEIETLEHSPDREAREAELRERAQQALREAGVLTYG